MKRLLLPLLFLSLAVSAGYAEDIKAPRNSQTENQRTENSHIENPRFGDESRYKIVAAPREIEADKNSQEKNPQYKKAAHQENAAVRKFNSSKIQKSNAVNLPDFLRGEGFFVMMTGGTGAQSQLSYKGYTSFCIKVYVDGILCNNSTTGEFDWNSIDINSIETIEIEDVPSLSEAEFAGCIVRITTKNGGDRISASVSTGSFERSAFDTWNAKVLYSREFEKANINFSSDVLVADNKFQTSYATNLYNFSRAGSAAFGWNVKLSEKFNLYGSDTFSYNFLKVSGYSLNTNLEEDIATRNNINLSYKNSDLKNEFKSDTSLFYNFGNVKFVNNLSTNNIDYTTFNKISVTENIKWVCDFTAGIDFEFLPGRMGDNGAGTGSSATGGSGSAMGAGNGSGGAWRVTERLGAAKRFEFYGFEIEPQLVVLFWQNAGKNDSGVGLLPRLTASYQGVTVAAFREFVLPTFNQLYWPDTSYASGNLNLKPEDGWSAFLGFKREDFPIWAQYKFSYYQNKIRWGSEIASGAGSGSGSGGASGAGSKMIPVNNGEAFYHVATLGFALSFFDGALNVSADGTYTSARLCDSGNQIMWVPQWQAHAAITGKVWRFTFMTDYSFTGERFKQNDNKEVYPAIHMWNASVAFDITPEWNCYFRVDNLLDWRVVYHDNYYVQSRKFTVGVKFVK